MGMISRIKNRMAKRKKNRALRKNGPETAYYGGSQRMQRKYQREARADVNHAERDANETREGTAAQQEKLDGASKRADTEYTKSKWQAQDSRDEYRGSIDNINADAANSIRNNALGTNQLTGSAESILSQRQAQLAGAPTIGQATDTALGAMQTNAQAQLQNQIAAQNRAARGLAGSMGEGGALAMQQALASAGAGSADLAAQTGMQQNQLAAQMRFGAAQTQNQQDIAAADQAVALRMGAAEQERQAQLGIAQANAGNVYDAALQQTQARAGLMGQDASTRGAMQNTYTNMLGNSANYAAGRAQMDQNALGDARQNNQFIEGTAAGINQAENQRAYEAAKNKNGFAKMISTVFDPGDLRGSGTKGIVG